MPGKKKKMKRKRPVMSVPALYSEDIGLGGLKTKQQQLSSTLQNASFHLPVNKQEENKRQKRMERFVEHNIGLSAALPTTREKETDHFASTKKIGKHKKLVGKSMALEKPYLRLTTAPRACDVRPLSVLRSSLSHVKAHYIENEDFEFANEQLKSIRQDITVQHLRNDFILEVYETHSRMLLEHGDLNEFNQCQNMIRRLTDPNSADVTKVSGKKKGGKIRVILQTEEASDEFRAYSLLYDAVQNSWSDLLVHIASEQTILDINNEFNGAGEKGEVPIHQGSSVRHALKVLKAIVHNDYHAFFRLYDSAPHMSAYLMDYLVRRVRNEGYERLIAAYRPTVSTELIREVLSFHDLEETRQFLKKKGAIFLNNKDSPTFWVDCKATYTSYVQSAKWMHRAGIGMLPTWEGKIYGQDSLW